MKNIHWKNKKTKLIFGAISILVVAPLIVYTNCGQMEEQAEEETASGFEPGFETSALSTCDNWHQEAYLKPSNTQTNDGFGAMWGQEISGDRIVIGAFYEDSSQSSITNGPGSSADNSATNAGAAYVFARVGGLWTQEAYLKPSNMNAFDFFGADVTISGDYIAVSSFNEASNQTTITNGSTASADNSSQQSGAVYIFGRVGGLWQQQAYIKASNANAGDQFGYQVSMFGTKLAVGAPYEDSNQTTITNGATASSNNALPNSGAVYVYNRSGLVWQQEAYIKAPNPDTDDGFGAFGMKLDSIRIIVGAPFEDSNQAIITNGVTASSNNSLTSSGAAYIFVKAPTGWKQEAYLKVSNVNASDLFGVSASLSGIQAVVGANGEDSNQVTITNGPFASLNNSSSGSGAAYVFTMNASGWHQTAYLKPSNANAGDAFGSSVSISKNFIVVGAPLEASNQSTVTLGNTASANNSLGMSGAAYMFEKDTAGWQQVAYLKASNANAGDEFGYHVNNSGYRVLVAAPYEDSNQTSITNGSGASTNNSAADSGAVYVFLCD